MSEATDPFEAYAALHLPKSRPGKVRIAKSDKDAPMKPSAMEQQQRDQSTLLANFKRAKKAEHLALLESAHGSAYMRMLGILKRLPDSAVELVEHLRKGWLQALSPQHKQTVLSVIDARIMHVREIDGRAPMDDPMPDAPDNLFLICRKIIKGH